jgi:hypothetical protein
MYSGGESKPLIFSYEWGKPGGEGEGQFKPPPCRHRRTMGLKVERVRVGIVRGAPHGVVLIVGNVTICGAGLVKGFTIIPLNSLCKLLINLQMQNIQGFLKVINS